MSMQSDMAALLDAGCHFGHQTKRWNPKMKPYIYGARNDVYIIDLESTVKKLEEACDFVREVTAQGGEILMVGTKKQAAPVIVDEATRSGAHYVTNRWLGGMLTNHSTIQLSIEKLERYERMAEDGTFDKLAKKEAQKLDKQREKLDGYLRGIRNMNGKLPAAMFVVDVRKEHIAVREARKLEIPVVAIVDTNCDPEMVDYVIPANDDALRSIALITAKLADAIIEGRELREEYAREGKHVRAKEVPGMREGMPKIPKGKAVVEVGVGRLREEEAAKPEGATEGAAGKPEGDAAKAEAGTEQPAADAPKADTAAEPGAEAGEAEAKPAEPETKPAEPEGEVADAQSKPAETAAEPEADAEKK